MQPILLINFEHATPAMAELGLEHLFGPLFQAVFTDDTDALKAALTADSLRSILAGLSDGGKRHALRRLVVALTTPGPALLEAEADPSKLKALEDAWALRPMTDAWGEFMGFFTSLGLSLPDIQGSSDESESRQQEKTKSGSTRGHSAKSSPRSRAAGGKQRSSQ